MNFASRMIHQPIAFDPDRGNEALDLFPDLTPELSALMRGVAGCSPYLKSLMEKERDWILPALDAPEDAVDHLFTQLRGCPPDQLANALRQAKRRIALLTGLADCAGVWTLEQVTGTLTRLADTACQLALQATVAAEIKRGKLPGATEDDIETAGHMAVFAMGKMGAYELNYSSDIDLICLFDESRYDRADYHEARASLVRATRKMATMLSDLTAEGYVFRTDLRLRPDPSVTPVCMAMTAAETYYESVGRTWERAAYIKARPAAGDIEAGKAFLKTLRPFVWRKHLDFAAIQDAHDMRLRIREHKGLGGKLDIYGHNMKLGRGGIREIEFFTQTRQLIAGGRDPDLRVRGTVEGLRILSEKGWIGQDAAEKLTDHYRFHRQVEHRIQMVNDAQTHALPNSHEGMQRIACFLGRDLDELKTDLRQRLEQVHDLTEGFFAPDAASPAGPPDLDPVNREVVQRWRSYPALRSSRAVEIFDRIKPRLFQQLARAAKPDEALHALDGFLAGLPAGVQLLSLFEANPQLIDLLVDIAGTAPRLAVFLSRNSSVFDAVIGGDFFADWPGLSRLRDDLAEQLSIEPDYERKLDLTRRWAKEWHFRIGVHHLRGLVDADGAAGQYADLAEAVLAALWPEVVAQFALKHGDCPGRGAMVLGMGSLGARRLNATSDLDLIVIYDADGVDSSDGRRPLATRAYYARLTQAMVTAVTALLPEGRLYEIDMRLRPSGTQGPVATSLASFRDYQLTEAWTWEHLALTRARAVAGDREVANDVEQVRRDVLTSPHEAAKVIADMIDMRGKIAAAKTSSGPWDAKLGPGRLQDIELMAQASAVIFGTCAQSVPEALDDAVRGGWLLQQERGALIASYQLCWKLQMVSKLLSDKPLNPDTIGQGGSAMLLRETDAPDVETLLAELKAKSAAAGAIINAALARDLSVSI
ncbi:glutamine-synthetase adenylyltransferase [Thalassovita sp.]|uniref:[protein-PII] uridylyltransferase family protein n=1 Tax=Thalassovita sp. TaxID=1979401 RepID=UPI002B26E738|nr:glutamine-synthetase adenylyltransferase [Thalassovita sp.]